MCNFFSCIVTKNDILWDKNTDSHEELITKFKLKDSSSNPKFVRVEVLPIDNNITNHKLSNWLAHVDQDLTPDWFDLKEVDKAIKKILPDVFKSLFVFEGAHEIREGRIFSCDSSTVTAFGSSTVTAYDSSTVTAHDSSTVKAYDSSTVTAYDSSTVKAYDSSTVKAYDSSTVTAHGSSTVKAYNSSTVTAWNYSNIIKYSGIIVLNNNAKMIDRSK